MSRRHPGIWLRNGSTRREARIRPRPRSFARLVDQRARTPVQATACACQRRSEHRSTRTAWPILYRHDWASVSALERAVQPGRSRLLDPERVRGRRGAANGERCAGPVLARPHHGRFRSEWGTSRSRGQRSSHELTLGHRAASVRCSPESPCSDLRHHPVWLASSGWFSANLCPSSATPVVSAPAAR